MPGGGSEKNKETVGDGWIGIRAMVWVLLREKERFVRLGDGRPILRSGPGGQGGGDEKILGRNGPEGGHL